jgi:hypothetical protein
MRSFVTSFNRYGVGHNDGLAHFIFFESVMLGNSISEAMLVLGYPQRTIFQSFDESVRKPSWQVNKRIFAFAKIFPIHSHQNYFSGLFRPSATLSDSQLYPVCKFTIDAYKIEISIS